MRGKVVSRYNPGTGRDSSYLNSRLVVLPIYLCAKMQCFASHIRLWSIPRSAVATHSRFLSAGMTTLDISNPRRMPFRLMDVHVVQLGNVPSGVHDGETKRDSAPNLDIVKAKKTKQSRQVVTAMFAH
jgi:hypothetical protein